MQSWTDQFPFYVICFDFLKQLHSLKVYVSTPAPVIVEKMSRTYCEADNQMFESTSFMETQAPSQTYKGDQIIVNKNAEKKIFF